MIEFFAPTDRAQWREIQQYLLDKIGAEDVTTWTWSVQRNSKNETIRRVRIYDPSLGESFLIFAMLKWGSHD